jgi:deoxyadenosine/deoxycytidine kinase
MDYFDFSVWDVNNVSFNGKMGKYIAICGNTGAGKSTLVKAIMERSKDYSFEMIGINERTLHHPLLKLMFKNPREYAYIVQLYFMLMRYSILYRWLKGGRTVVIERSHLDDIIFVQDHVDSRHITEEQYELYVNLSNVLHKSLPDPDIYVYLDVPPELSIERLKISEENEHRPREFPNDSIKYRYIYSWYERYSILINEIIDSQKKGLKFYKTQIITWPAVTNMDLMADVIISRYITLINIQ